MNELLINGTFVKGYVVKKKSPAAGFILIKYFHDQPKVLGLMDVDKFDLPKGAIEPGETIIDAAFRECAEECGIVPTEFPWGLKNTMVNHVTLFVAVTEDEPNILPNPATCEIEHQYAEWLDLDSGVKYFKPYLQPAILWARSMMRGEI